MEISNYSHKIEEEVKFHEVDMMGICNNAVYLNYFEDGRVKYIQNLKQTYKLQTIMEGGSFFITARNEVDYIEPALFDEKLNIYTRIDFIKNSSFGFRHIVENDKTKKILATGVGIFVHINLKTKKSVPLPQEFYDAVSGFEKQVNIVRDK